MEVVKNKGGRPTKAEQAAKGITESELKPALRKMKPKLPLILQELMDLMDDPSLSVAAKIKVRLDWMKLYESFLKTNKHLLAADDVQESDSSDEEEKPQFRLA